MIHTQCVLHTHKIISQTECGTLHCLSVLQIEQQRIDTVYTRVSMQQKSIYEGGYEQV